MRIQIEPRIIRAKWAPGYCGMNASQFNDEIRLYVTEIPVGERGIGFDRLDLDEALDEYKKRCGRAPDSEEHSQCSRKKARQGSNASTASGRSIKPSTAEDFIEAVRRVRLKKPSNTSPGLSRNSA